MVRGVQGLLNHRDVHLLHHHHYFLGGLANRWGLVDLVPPDFLEVRGDRIFLQLHGDPEALVFQMIPVVQMVLEAQELLVYRPRLSQSHHLLCKFPNRRQESPLLLLGLSVPWDLQALAGPIPRLP